MKTQIEYPLDIQSDLEKAWYLKTQYSLTYQEIGEILNYSSTGAHALLSRGFKQQSTPQIYRKVTEFCRKQCDYTGPCRDCMLSKFVLANLLRKSMRNFA